MLNTQMNLAKTDLQLPLGAPSSRKEEPKSEVDFEKVLGESNYQTALEREKEKAAVANGELRIGEAKTDKEFRETLEKITGKKQEALKNKLDKDDYLNLLVTQMRFQDPTKPMEHQEMASQLAQFNSVEQLTGMNRILNDMNENQKSSGNQKLTEYIDTEIEAKTNQVRLDYQGLKTKAFIHLPSDASVVSISFKNEAGIEVHRMPLGNLKTGEHPLAWDGKDAQGNKLPPGKYTFSVEASTVEGKPLEVKTMIRTAVTGVSQLETGGKLETAEGALELSHIVSVRKKSALAEVA